MRDEILYMDFENPSSLATCTTQKKQEIMIFTASRVIKRHKAHLTSYRKNHTRKSL